MPFLHLGFGLATLVTKGIRKIFEPFVDVQRSEKLPSVDQDLLENENNTQQEKTGEEKKNPDIDQSFLKDDKEIRASPALNLCRFSNSYRNCWFNCVMQAVLNYGPVRRALSGDNAEQLCIFERMSLCTRFLLRTVRNPRRFFSQAEMFPVLEELSKIVPSLALSKPNGLTTFLEPLMKWLEVCGVQSALLKKTHCTVCKFTSTSPTVWDHIYFMPLTNQTELTSNLFRQMEDENGSQACVKCKSRQQKQVFFNSPDVINIYQDRVLEQNLPRIPISYPVTLVIPTQTGTETYRLSSVISHLRGTSPRADHAYTYVFLNGQIIKANDCFIYVVPYEEAQTDINENGVLYMYEKCTKE